MRLPGRMEISSGWCHIAKHIPGHDDTLADGISRWPEDKLRENVARTTNDDDWREQDIQAHDRKILSLLLTANQITRRKIGRTDVATDEQSQRRSSLRQ